MKLSWQIGLPGHSTIGTRVRFVISSVSVPAKPGSTKPAVAWTISPRRPRLDLPSILATRSSSSSTHSWVAPSANSPGWITNDSSSEILICSVRSRGGLARSIACARWLWKTRNDVPSRRSTDAGWTSDGSHGSIRRRPSWTRRRIVPSDRTEVTSLTRESVSGLRVQRPVDHREARGLSALLRHPARPDLQWAHARGRQRHAVAVRPAPRGPRQARRRVRTGGHAAAPVRRLLIRRLMHRPPHDPAQRGDGQLQEDEEVQHRPAHVADATCEPPSRNPPASEFRPAAESGRPRSA